MLGQVLNLIDGGFRTTGVRVVGWGVIAATIGVGVTCLLPDTDWIQRSLVGVVLGTAAALLIGGFGGIAAYQRVQSQPTGRVPWSAAPKLFLMYTGLLMFVFGSVTVLLSMIMKLR